MHIIMIQQEEVGKKQHLQLVQKIARVMKNPDKMVSIAGNQITI
jgi:hypothetical protein